MKLLSCVLFTVSTALVVACGGASKEGGSTTEDATAEHSTADDGDAKCKLFETDVEAVWGDSQRDDIRTALSGSSSDPAAGSAEGVVSQMDAVTRDWVERREKLCMDAFVHEVLPQHVYMKMTACLDDALMALRLFTTQVASSEGMTVEQANQALDSIFQRRDECLLQASGGAAGTQ
jgi:hypothetical protein